MSSDEQRIQHEKTAPIDHQQQELGQIQNAMKLDLHQHSITQERQFVDIFIQRIVILDM